MAQCIRLTCRNDAWGEDDKKSYFCMDCAYLMLRGHLVLTKAQLEIFNKEGFIDHLCGESEIGYPMTSSRQREFLTYRFGDYVDKRRRALAKYGRTLDDWHTCMEINCGKPIIGAARRCGACRTRLRISEKTDRNPPQIKCDNWNWAEPGMAAPGHHLTSTCLKQFPVDRSFKVGSLTLCPMCWNRLRMQDREFYEIYGYPELTRFYEIQEARARRIERESKY